MGDRGRGPGRMGPGRMGPGRDGALCGPSLVLVLSWSMLNFSAAAFAYIPRLVLK
jgi:hypothetical protein